MAKDQTKEGFMNLFSYNTICTQLNPETKTLIVTLNRPELGNPINLEFLFEFQSLLNWANNKIEIASILVNSSGDQFSEGLSEEFIKNADIKKLSKIREELFETQKLMINAPATIIFDLKQGAKNIALELSFAADIRVASLESQIQMNQLNLGLPFFSTTPLITEVFSRTQFQNMVNDTKPIKVSMLHKTGFIKDIYDSSNQSEVIEKYLLNIKSQAQLPRVQTKFLLARNLVQKMDQFFDVETGLFNAACATADWKNKNQSPLKEVKKAVKMTLIQGGTDQ